MRSVSTGLMLGFVLLCGSLALGQSSAARRPVRVADAIEMAKIQTNAGRIASFSPDGAKFVVVLKRPNLSRNVNEYDLLLWHTDDLWKGDKPERILTLASSSNRPAITNPQWASDNRTIMFLGERPMEARQVYSFDFRTRELKQLSHSKTSVVSYSTDVTGSTILYAADPDLGKLLDDPRVSHDGFVVSKESIDDFLYEPMRLALAEFDGKYQFVLERPNTKPLILPSTLFSPAKTYRPSLSPNGRYAVIMSIVDQFPPAWKDYTSHGVQWWAQDRKTPKTSGESVYCLQTLLLDTYTGDIRPFLGAPTSTTDHAEVAWSPDSQSILITNTYLPLNGIDSEELQIRRQKTFAAVIASVPSGAILSKLDAERPLKSPLWLDADHLAAKLSGYPASDDNIEYLKQNGHWVPTDSKGLEAMPATIEVDQGLNTPPTIVASDKLGRRVVLLDPNPQFAELQFAKEEVIRWKGTDGHEVKGGLYYPINYEPGKRYPLVIQTHGFHPDRFWIDGPFSTAFAAQALAAKGFMVVQVESNYEGSDTHTEVDREVSGLEGAIQYLNDRGFIDPRKVGIIGFSRTCLYVMHALTQSDFQFAAASITDGVDNGFVQYVLTTGNNIIQLAYEGNIGAAPFGKGLQRWFQRSPGFNLDKNKAPLLIFALDPSSVLFEWQNWALLKRLEKPVEMIVIRDGSHELERPWDRRISMENNVDWFCFWLQGAEDQDPAKADKYSRWRRLREKQEADISSQEVTN